MLDGQQSEPVGLRGISQDECTWRIEDSYGWLHGYVDKSVAATMEEAVDWWVHSQNVKTDAGFNGIKDEDFQLHPSRDDVINNPMHYKVGGYEAIDVIKAKLTPEEYRGYCKGNVLKYLMRANYKGHHDTDIGKARYYIEELDYELETNQSTTHWFDEVTVREEDSGTPF